MTTPPPTGTGRQTNENFVSPDPHKVLNNHYKPLIKLNYNDSLELAPPEQGQKNYENFVQSSPHPPRLPVKCRRTGTTSLTSYQRSRPKIHSNGAKSHSGAMYAIRATIHRKTSYRLTGGLKLDGRMTRRDGEHYTKSVVPHDTVRTVCV